MNKRAIINQVHIVQNTFLFSSRQILLRKNLNLWRCKHKVELINLCLVYQNTIVLLKYHLIKEHILFQKYQMENILFSFAQNITIKIIYVQNILLSMTI